MYQVPLQLKSRIAHIFMVIREYGFANTPFSGHQKLSVCLNKSHNHDYGKET